MTYTYNPDHTLLEAIEGARSLGYEITRNGRFTTVIGPDKTGATALGAGGLWATLLDFGVVPGGLTEEQAQLAMAARERYVRDGGPTWA